jgi:hypothetical protein
VSSKVVVAASGAHQPARRIGLEPALGLAPVPDAVLWSKHPPAPFAVEHREVAHREPERARLEGAAAALRDEGLVTGLCFGERIDGHGLTVWAARSGGVREVAV